MTISLPTALYRRTVRLAREDQRSLRSLIRIALQEHLNRHEQPEEKPPEQRPS